MAFSGVFHALIIRNLSLFFHLHNLPHLTDLTKLHHQEYHSRSLTRCRFMTRSVRISPDR
ncbi:hypothetical protein HanXRQr2_Chr00c156g0834121 [Helianthus annuus]|uniref:Uncharacterized protein n=1 Tax=Helianthus annuus TaxID=4232 RepID=A0A251TA76_HELAN|nr:hypothetical protein HanXRQr2_Chr00c156g0834121 [Helianthus annuus]KAJ0873728.1 hypothetical protein HanPSC8_Chr11g0455801 [Helianthus annuus]